MPCLKEKSEDVRGIGCFHVYSTSWYQGPSCIYSQQKSGPRVHLSSAGDKDGMFSTYATVQHVKAGGYLRRRKHDMTSYQHLYCKMSTTGLCWQQWIDTSKTTTDRQTCTQSTYNMSMTLQEASDLFELKCPDNRISFTSFRKTTPSGFVAYLTPTGGLASAKCVVTLPWRLKFWQLHSLTHLNKTLCPYDDVTSVRSAQCVSHNE